MKCLVFAATYNENGNIQLLYEDLRRRYPTFSILIVDDASTDGTLQFLKYVEQRDSNFYLIQRASKLGLGSAHNLAFVFAFENDYDFLITMDADLSHRPDQIQRFINEIAKSDFVVGTRQNNGSTSYTGMRKIMSRSANFMCKKLLSCGVTEYTSSFRIFSRTAVAYLVKHGSKKNDYSFFIETIVKLKENGFRITEVPIDFECRENGASKIPKGQIILSLQTLTFLSLSQLLSKITNK